MQHVAKESNTMNGSRPERASREPSKTCWQRSRNTSSSQKASSWSLKPWQSALKSLKVFTKLNEIRALCVFSTSAAASGVARRCFSAPGAALFHFRIDLKLLFEVQGSIPSRLESFLNFSINSAKELTLLEQRTLAQLLLVVLVVVALLEL